MRAPQSSVAEPSGRTGDRASSRRRTPCRRPTHRGAPGLSHGSRPVSRSLGGRSRPLPGLARARETENAKKILLRYITKSPENPTLLAELAGLWHFEHEFETAIWLNTCLTYLTPAKALPHANLAEGLAEVQREVEALSRIEKAIELDPSSAQLRLNSAFTLLALGRYRDGWTAYEARLAPKIPDLPRRARDKPRWDGETLDKKHILVCSEQGTGDQLFFGAYLPGLVNRAAGATV